MLWERLGKHDNIVAYLDSELQEIDDDVEMLILCELCQGGFTLIDMLEQCKGKIPEHVVLSIMSDLAAGVAHMHKLGMAHWDLKVENVLMGTDHKFKLADYGSAQDEQFFVKWEEKPNSKLLAHKFEYFERNTTMMYRAPEMIDQY